MTSIDNATATPSPPPPNHGQKWTPEEDRQIADAPTACCDDNNSDRNLALTLGRSAHAVQSRRAVLAARLHATTGRSIEECAHELGANVARTTAAVAAATGGGSDGKERKGGDRKMRMNQFNNDATDGGRTGMAEQEIRERQKPKKHSIITFASDNHADGSNINNRRPHHHHTTTFTSRAPPVTGILRPPQHPHNHQTTAAIGVICNFIKKNAGGGVSTMNELWMQEALVPTLVQYYAGFQAYVAFVGKTVDRR